MSYDLTVYSRTEIAREAVIELIHESPDLRAQGENTTGALTVMRGKRMDYCFTVDGPFAIEAEDLPDEIVPLTIGVTSTYQVLVEGSSAVAIPIAIRFAKRLAEQGRGAMHDQQTDQVWTRGKNRAPIRPAPQEKADVIELNWYFPRSATDLARQYLDLVTRFLPEALPRRFGEFEPLQGKLDVAGAKGFIEAAESSRSMFFWKGSYPLSYGYFFGRDFDGSTPAIQRIELQLARPSFEDPDWRAALEKLFVQFATAGDAYLAVAEVLRSNVAGPSRGFNGDEYRDNLMDNVRGNRFWLGLPPYPVWWTYFGSAYSRLVANDLSRAITRNVGDGVFAQWSNAPLDRDSLQSKLRQGSHGRGDAGNWIPKELQLKQRPFVVGSYPRPAQKAERIPGELTELV